MAANMLCQKEFENFSKNSGLDGLQFRAESGDRYDEQVFRSLPLAIGEWSEVHISERKIPFVLKMDDEKLVKHSFSAACEPTMENAKWPDSLEAVFSRTMAEDWKNADLKKLVSTEKKGVIYSWSPKFTYSVLVLPKMEQLAHAMGYEFTAVVDPRASREEILASLKALPKQTSLKLRSLASDKKFTRNMSLDLFMRAAFNHYPVTFVYNKGKIHPRFVTGVMTDNGFKKLVETYAGEL